MRLTCYLRKGTIYIPTLGIRQEGFYQGVEPTAVVSVFNRPDLRKAVLDTMALGNPAISSPPGGEHPESLMLEHAGLKSWAAFAKGMTSVSVDQKDGHYQIIGKKKRPDRGLEEDPEQTITFPAGATLDDVVDRLIAILQEKAAQT